MYAENLIRLGNAHIYILRGSARHAESFHSFKNLPFQTSRTLQYVPVGETRSELGTSVINDLNHIEL